MPAGCEESKENVLPGRTSRLLVAQVPLLIISFSYRRPTMRPAVKVRGSSLPKFRDSPDISCFLLTGTVRHSATASEEFVKLLP